MFLLNSLQGLINVCLHSKPSESAHPPRPCVPEVIHNPGPLFSCLPASITPFILAQLLPCLQILPPLWSFIYPNVPSPPTWGHCPWRGGCPLPPECPIALCRLCTVHPPLNLAEHVHSMLRVSLCDVGVKPSNATTTRVDLHRWGQISLDGPSHVSV